MARRLQAMIADLDLRARSFELRNGDAVGDLPRSPSRDDVAWELAGAPAGRVNWLGQAYDRHVARATLPADEDGLYTTDTAWDVGANGERTCTTPTLAASSVRAWLAVEIYYLQPADTEVLLRAVLDGSEVWWDGGDWSAAADPDEWTDVVAFAANFSSLPATDRQLAIRAWLRTDDEAATPTFYGARVLYGVVGVGDVYDALNATVLASLRDEVRVGGVQQVDTGAGLASLDLDAEHPYDLIAVDAAFNLTDDPDELVELAGALAGTTWTPTTPIGPSKVLRVEYSFRPWCVVAEHRSAERLDRLPRIALRPDAGAERDRWSSSDQVRNLATSPPVAQVLPTQHTVRQDVAITLTAEWGADLERMRRAFREWLGDGDGRVLVSPLTGRVISLELVSELEDVTGILASGVHEARGLLRLTYPGAQRDTVRAAELVDPGNFTATIQGE